MGFPLAKGLTRGVSLRSALGQASPAARAPSNSRAVLLSLAGT